MSRNRWLERPWLLALGTLAVALLPVAFGFLSYRAAADRSDRELLETATRLAQQSLRLSTVRHLNLLVSFRGQLQLVSNPASIDSFVSFQNREWHTNFPHWRTIAYAENTGGKAVVRWIRDFDDASPVTVGEDILLESHLANALQQSRERPFQQFAAKWSTGRMAVVSSVLDQRRTQVRGFLICWLDIDGLCRDPKLPLVTEGALKLTPLSDGASPVQGGTVFAIEESGVVWNVSVERGPHFASVFARPTPWLVLGGGTLCALLLATLTWLAAGSRRQSLRTAELNAALEAEREVGRLRSHFINSVSHEFRTPLSVILSSTDLLEIYSEKLTPERRKEALDRIKEATSQMTGMVEEVLLLGRIESQRVQCKPAAVDVDALCKQLAIATGATLPDRARRIDIEVGAGMEDVELDATLLRSMLGNLLSNAVKYSPPGSTVTLTASSSDDVITFTVRDEGIGIPNEDLPQVGAPFYRGSNVGDAAGTGLGLAIVRRCAALHHGKLEITSEEGAGTVATITLPCRRVAVGPALSAS
ncbi:MAG TPA: HAMP domain-containing sensor histidine kinase [Roseimicrobium sp.]|nr:HAMP domain-containing sensor histidine kinase [Roseimicrobium sp.]